MSGRGRAVASRLNPAASPRHCMRLARLGDARVPSGPSNGCMHSMKLTCTYSKLLINDRGCLPPFPGSSIVSFGDLSLTLFSHCLSVCLFVSNSEHTRRLRRLKVSQAILFYSCIL